MQVEYEFETEIDVGSLEEPVTAFIQYVASPVDIETRYYTKQGFEVEVTHTKYSIAASGNILRCLNIIAQEQAEEHFSKRSSPWE